MLLVQKAGISMRPSQTFQKRQRELARQEKQRAKAQRKLQRKIEKQSPTQDQDQDQDILHSPAGPAGTEEPGA
jgi:hypothetical protein